MYDFLEIMYIFPFTDVFKGFQKVLHYDYYNE